LAPGDVRVLSGLTRELQGPPGGCPYIPGGDCCGIVVELPEQQQQQEELPFKVGDRVAVGFLEAPRGALAEYAIVSHIVAYKVPDSISSVDAAALVSAAPGIFLAEDYIREDERVLVLGAGGGVGTTFCQRLLHNNVNAASLLVGVGSTETGRLWRKNGLFSDYDFIDYTQTDPLAVEKYLAKENRYDVIVDFVGGGFQRLEERVKANEPIPVKTAAEGGRFITTVPPIGPTYEIHGWLQLIRCFLLPPLWKAFISRTWYRRRLPAYTMGLVIPMERRRASRPMELAEDGQLKAVVDPEGPFPFTTQGVRDAFRKQQSRHAHGKVVIRVAD
jgi:NADPH:quinone reductase-like Zn-dependent oxidoreductase